MPRTIVSLRQVCARIRSQPNLQMRVREPRTLAIVKKELHVADSASNKSDQLVAERCDIQHVVDTDTENGGASSSGATQAGARRSRPFPLTSQV